MSNAVRAKSDELAIPYPLPQVPFMAPDTHRAPDGARVHYERHRPEQTALYRLVQQRAATFFAHVQAAAGADLPQFVKDCVQAAHIPTVGTSALVPQETPTASGDVGAVDRRDQAFMEMAAHVIAFREFILLSPVTS